MRGFPSLRTPKIKVEIILPDGNTILKKREIVENTVLIDRGTKGRGGAAWQPAFKNSCIVRERRGFIIKRSMRKLVVKLGAKECLDFYGKDVITPDIPTREDIANLFKARVLEAAGRSLTKVQIPWYVTLLIFLAFLFSFLQFIGARGVNF